MRVESTLLRAIWKPTKLHAMSGPVGPVEHQAPPCCLIAPKGCNSTEVAGKHEKHVETVGETLFVGPFSILQQWFWRGFSIVFSIGFNSIGYRPEHRHFAAGASRLTKFARENRPGPTYFGVNPPFLEQIHIPNASKRLPYDGVNPHLPYWHRPIDVDFLDKLRTQKKRTQCNFNEAQWTSMKLNELQWISMKFNERTSMKFNEIKWTSMNFNEVQWNSMKFNEIQWSSMLFQTACG